MVKKGTDVVGFSMGQRVPLSTSKTLNKNVLIAGTAIFSALVAILEYLSLVFPVLRISFIPPLTFLKFDMAEIPAFLSYLVFGLPVGIATSLMVPFVIIARGTSNPVGAVIKGLAVLFTILGFAAFNKKSRWVAGLTGTTSRVLSMVFVNALILPFLFPDRYSTEMFIQALTAMFNLIHGLLTIGGAFMIYLKMPKLSIIQKNVQEKDKQIF